MGDSCQFGCVGVVFFSRAQRDRKVLNDLAGPRHRYRNPNGSSHANEIVPRRAACCYSHNNLATTSVRPG
ncbi:Uncharacterized protein HZ326_26980 [Fusarium oxysporum f. sp. albedinis]|nr:Uncharacterized protein HZ326_26980 [Fusarium oxysporum f. sp. albedinis]